MKSCNWPTLSSPPSTLRPPYHQMILRRERNGRLIFQSEGGTDIQCASDVHASGDLLRIRIEGGVGARAGGGGRGDDLARASPGAIVLIRLVERDLDLAAPERVSEARILDDDVERGVDGRPCPCPPRRRCF